MSFRGSAAPPPNPPRVAIVSDIHGNLKGLEAVVADIEREAPDLVVHGGDLALSGGRPAECIDLIKEAGWAGVVGNTDELMWNPDELDVQLRKAPALEGLLRVLFHDFAPATLERIGPDRLAWLRALPSEWRGDGVAMVHASPGDLWRAPMPDADDALFERTYRGLDAAVAVYGHIHRPFVRSVGGFVVANSGSAGQPFDGDPRASYLLITDGVPEVRRVVYDVSSEASDLAKSGYPHADWLSEMRRKAAFLPTAL